MESSVALLLQPHCVTRLATVWISALITALDHRVS
jgi:hypothetical protein